MQYYDAHTHLNSPALYPEWKSILTRFGEIGGKGLVNIGVNKIYNEQALEIARLAPETHPGIGVWCTLGYHPCEVAEHVHYFTEQMADGGVRLKQELMTMIMGQRKDVVGIGECGIDIYYEGSFASLDLQKKVFRAQCQVARDLSLPVVVHSRADFASTVEVMEEFEDVVFYFHCRGYAPREVQALLAMPHKIYIGVCANSSYPKAVDIRESVPLIPWDRLLLETDAPYLAPKELRGQTNEPSFLTYHYTFIAELLGVDKQTLAAQVADNFFAIYGVR